MQTVAVGGETAASKDYNATLSGHTPLVFTFVLGLAFLLLLVTFRSIVIPLKAILLNLLSVGAAYGFLVAVFQWGWGEHILGFRSTGGITSWIPLFLFVVLFGLSMDYHVFVLSRIREAVDRGMKTEDAVSHGIRTTAGVVTSAALVMVVVFSIFGSLSTVSMKEIGGRPRRRRPDRRHGRPRHPAPRDDEAPWRLELVATPSAPLAAPDQPRSSPSSRARPRDQPLRHPTTRNPLPAPSNLGAGSTSPPSGTAQ